MRFFPALWAFFAAIILAGCNDEIRDFDLTQYEKATVVGTYSLGKDREEIHTKTSEGVNVTVILVSSVSVFIKFQDEKNEREICHTDWNFLSEIRQLRENDLLFVKIAGSHLTSHSEWQNEQKIFVYNLSSRNLIGWVKIH